MVDGEVGLSLPFAASDALGDDDLEVLLVAVDPLVLGSELSAPVTGAVPVGEADSGTQPEIGRGVVHIVVGALLGLVRTVGIDVGQDSAVIDGVVFKDDVADDHLGALAASAEVED